MIFRRLALFIILFYAGCSTHPVTDMCDFLKPGKIYPSNIQPYGGVGIPQGPIIPVAPNVAVGPPAPLPGGPIVPPPAPLPGAGGPGLQLQPPMGDALPSFPPPPPPPPTKN